MVMVEGDYNQEVYFVEVKGRCQEVLRYEG